MKTISKITFKGKIGFDAITKVYYKNVYFGRIIFNNFGLMEFHEKNEPSFHKFNIVDKEFNDPEKIKRYVIEKIHKREKYNITNREYNLTRLTPHAKAFFKLFLSNNIIKRKDLSNKYKSSADFFVLEELLEKELIDDNVVYIAKKPICKLLKNMFQ